MRLLKIRLEDFKGFTGKRTGKEFCFGQRTLVEGRNAAGKSTIMDAHLWLFTDKDSKLKSNPDIRPDNGRECIPRVEEEWEIDGTIVTIAKMQKKSVGKPDERGISKISLSNKYEINGVPKTERDFKKDLTERGFDFDNFLPLSHIDVFTSGNEKDMRNVLFGMTSSKTDEEIACGLDGCEDVAELLRSYKADEIEAMNKASKKKAEEQIQAIPNQIIGMEKAKVNIDTAELELQRKELMRIIEEYENQLSSSAPNTELMDRLSKEIWDLKSKSISIVTQERESLNFAVHEIKEKISKLEYSKKNKEAALRLYNTELSDLISEIKMHEEKRESLLRDWEKENESEFSTEEHSDICKYSEKPCNYIMSKNEEEFNKRKDNRIADIVEQGNKEKEQIITCNKSKKEIEDRTGQLNKDIENFETEIERLNTELLKFPNEIDISGNKEYQSILKQISDKESELASMDNGSEYRKSKENELKAKRQELSEVESEIAKAQNDVRIDEQIAELRNKKSEYIQKKADSDSILYQLSLVSRAKNTLLEKEINSNFNGARFKLFEYLKNGEYKEVCVLEILDENEEWKTIDKTANTALEMEGKMAVIDGLQRFYGVRYPVFVDFAAELDMDNLSRIRPDFQVIFLRVGSGKLRVEEMG